MASKPLEQRIYKLSIPEPNTGCWLWIGARKPPYGYMPVDGRDVRAHRVAAHIWHGLDLTDPSVIVRHICDTPLCVNPRHLLLGTNKENSADAMRRGRQTRGEKVGISKLNEIKVLILLKRLDNGESVSSLANYLGVAVPTIHAIIGQYSWKWVTDQHPELFNRVVHKVSISKFTQRAKKVKCLITGLVFVSMHAAGKHFNISPAYVCVSAKNNGKSISGYKFIYYED